MQRLQDDELSDEPLLEEFKVLRRRIFQWNGECILQNLAYSCVTLAYEIGIWLVCVILRDRGLSHKLYVGNC